MYEDKGAIFLLDMITNLSMVNANTWNQTSDEPDGE